MNAEGKPSLTPDPQKSVILTVDDDANNLAVLHDCLDGCNFTLLTAENGESAIRRADYAQPDLILLDVMMPGIDGFETCRRLKSMESTKDIPVIFMTALAETGHKVKGLESGAVDYITKPFQREELLARVSVHLHNRQLTRDLQKSKDELEYRVEERTLDLAISNRELEDEMAQRQRAQEKLQEQALILEKKVEELQRTQAALQNEIEERKRNEEERIRLTTAIDQVAEAICMTDAQGKITYLNPAFERINGYCRDEVLGKNTGIFSSDLHTPEFFRQLNESVLRDDVWTGRITSKRKDGSLYKADTTISVVRDSEGAIINYVTIHRDVTNELKMERELRQSQKMEAIGTLAGGIAHDFNNILTAIVGYTAIAQSKIPKNHSAAHDLERVAEASNRATELIRRILTFSRKGEQERKPLHMATVVEEVFKLLRATLPSSIELKQQINADSDADMVLADSTQLHQVLMNLGANAAHAMRARGGVFTVALADIDADASLVKIFPDLTPGPYVRLTVSDNGHGMEATTRDRIFEPYFTTKKIGEGTGMGLSVVQGIVKSHGGSISVYSEPGKGTVFHIFLPRIAKALSSDREKPELTGGGSERILFVDDEQILAELGEELLKALGYRVTAETSSSESLKLFRANPGGYDLVITDMTMPGLTGRELAKEIRAIRPEIPIIMCSGFTEFLNQGEAKEAGISEFLMKPYVANKLDQLIRTVLSQQPSATEKI